MSDNRSGGEYGFGSFDVSRRVVDNLVIDGQNVIRPWGVEFADADSFFSLEEGVGWRNSLEEFSQTREGPCLKTAAVVRLSSGTFRVELEESMETPSEFRRIFQLVPMEDAELFDCVLRFRFNSGFFHEAYIAGQTLPYEGTNIYHQYPADRAGVGNLFFSLWAQVEKWTGPDGWKGNLYVRDSENTWILHARMMPTRWEREVIRLCSTVFRTRPLPRPVNSILLNIPGVRDALWLRGERKPYVGRVARMVAPTAYPIARVKKGDLFLWDVRLKVRSPRLIPGLNG